MSNSDSGRTSLPISFSAANVLQLLAAIACFMAAYILPASFPEFAGTTRYALLALGCGFLLVIAVSLMLRKWLLKISQKLGIRSRMLLPREGIVYLAIMLIIAVAALTGGNPDTGNMLLLIFGMMAGPFVFNGWVVVAMLARVKVSRHLPVSVAAETVFSVEIRLKNEKRLLSSRLVEVRDTIEGHQTSQAVKVVFVRVGPGEQRSAHYDVCIARRGCYQFGPLRLSSRFPLGIGERGHVVIAGDEVIVHPKIGRLLPAWQRRERELAETINRGNARQGVFDDEFHTIREYRSGDNPRAIHWRSSARHGHFMVKEHEQHREADLIVLLDLCATTGFPEPLQERAISLAATICVEQTRQISSGRYRLLIAGKDLRSVECSGSGRFREEALKELAVCQASAKAELASMLLAVCQSQPSPNSRFVLITPRPETARLLADSIAQANLQHEQQFTGRLMIVNADEQTLSATLAFVSDDTKLPETAHAALSDAGDATPVQRLAESGGRHVLSSGDEKLRSAFFRSMTLTAAMAGVILCHSEGHYFPAALTPIVAVAAWVFVDQLQWLRMPAWLVNLSGLSAVGFSIYNLGHGTIEDKLLAGTHMLVYLTCIVLLMQKGFRQYWWLMALILLQMAVAAVLKTGVFFGGSMLAMMALLLWTLSVFSLYRVMDEHRRQQSADDAPIRKSNPGSASGRGSREQDKVRLIHVNDGLQRDSSETWLSWRFRTMVGGSYLVSLVLAAFVFAAFPRVWEQGATSFAADLARESGLASRSGFTESVTLGHVGSLALSQERVLSYSAKNLKTQKQISSEFLATALNMDEIRFRGIALDRYYRGRWFIGFDESLIPGLPYRRRQVPGSGNLTPEFEIRITQDAPVGDFAFAPYPVLNVIAEDGLRIDRRSGNGQLLWRGKSSNTLPRSFTVQCPRVDPAVTLHDPAMDLEIPRRTDRESRRYSLQRGMGTGFGSSPAQANIDDELPSLHETANSLCTADGKLIPEAERVNRILQFLKPENGFVYSTSQTRKNMDVDPVEDFVFHTKSGHCEYFASACALMLQSVKIPARLVNGYYGSDLNTLTGWYEVRQRHAHSWVEAFVDDRWQTLEPTPESPRRAMVSAERSDSLIVNLQTAISDLWDNGVHNMSAARQKEFFAPVLSTSRSMFDTIRQHGLLAAIWTGIQEFLSSPKSLFSWRGGLGTFLILLTCGVIHRLRLTVRLSAAVRSLLAQFSGEKRARRSVIRFYAGFCALCESHGMNLQDANSALENGRTAVQRFAAHLDSDELRQLPIRIATAFNAVRFGNAELTKEQAADIGRDLTLFANALSSHYVMNRSVKRS